MTVYGTDNLSTPHTQREFGAEPAPAADVSTEAVTRLINGMWERCERAEARAAERMLTALLARAESAEAEVARLSTPPDDAEVAALVAELGEPLVIIEGYSADYVDTDDVRERMGKAADALTRLSHAHAARRRPDAGKGCIHTTPCTCGEPE